MSDCVKILSSGSVTILDLEGELDIYTATDFKEALLESIAGGARHVIVDATKVTFMDSSALSVLIGGRQRLHSLGGSLAVVCTDRIERLLTITGLQHAFALYATRDAALRAAAGR
jgi:anti-sigma B factor antagonist